jgi:uncharacterized peroxidase-related enzyme
LAFIETIDEERATGRAAEILAADREAMGFVPNFTQLFAQRPEVYAAWQQLKAAVSESMDTRRYELVTLAAASRLQSTYCSLAHGKILAERFLGAETVQMLAADHRTAGLDEVDVAVMDLAEKVAGDPTSVTQQDVDRLRELGLTDRDIFDVVVAAAARCFFSKTLDALGAEPDAVYAGLEPALRDALTVGRPMPPAERPV